MEKKIKKKNLGIGAVVCAVVLIGGGIFVLDRILPQVNPPQDAMEALPAGYGLITGQDNIEDLLAQSDIHTVVIPKDAYVILGSCRLQKELVIESGGVLEAGYLEIGENGHISVEGTLDIQNGILDAEGDKERISVSGTGVVLENGNSRMDDKLFESAVTVRTEDELVKAAGSGQSIRIEGDIVLTDSIEIKVPVRIGADASLCTRNAGTLCFDGGTVVNYGEIIGNCQYRGGVLYNIGTVNASNFLLLEGSVFNYGLLNAMEGDGAFSVENGGNLYNYGTFTALESALVINDGWIENAGKFIVENDARIDNNVFYNRNYFESGFSSTLDEKSGIYFGKGEFRMNGITNIAVWKTLDWRKTDQYQTVASEEELAAAMDDTEVMAIHVETPLAIQNDITITKPVFVSAPIRCKTDNCMELKNTYMVLLCSDASVDTQNLVMDNSLIVEQEGQLELDRAQITMKDGSAIASFAGEMTFSESNIFMEEKSVLSLPLKSGTSADEWSVYMDESRLVCGNSIAFQGAEIRAENKSYLQMFGRESHLDACEITTDSTTECQALYTDLILENQSLLQNNGILEIDGLPENKVRLENSVIHNLGHMTLNIELEKTDGSLVNDGDLETILLERSIYEE